MYRKVQTGMTVNVKFNYDVEKWIDGETGRIIEPYEWYNPTANKVKVNSENYN